MGYVYSNPTVLDGAANVGANYLSPAVSKKLSDLIAIQCVWTGTPTGVLSLVTSIDGVNYDPYPLTVTGSQPSGSAGSFVFDLPATALPNFKVNYAYTSGAGTMVVTYILESM